MVDGYDSNLARKAIVDFLQNVIFGLFCTFLYVFASITVVICPFMPVIENKLLSLQRK